MSYDRLLFAGRVHGPKDESVVGAQVVLADDSRKEVLASTLTGPDGDFRIELIQTVNPVLFARIAKDKVALQVFGAGGDALGAKGGLTCRVGEACMVDLRLTAAAFKRFQPLFSVAQRLSGPILEPSTLALIDSAIAAMVPPGMPGHNYYLKAVRCPLPDIQVFDSLLDEAWNVLDGAPDAERRLRAILDLVPERRPEGRRAELIERGAALLKGTALEAGRGDRASFGESSAARTGAHPHSSASAMLRPIPNGPLANPFPCALPFERMAPPYLAALRIARDFDDAAALVGALELGLCGLDRIHRLLDGALRGLSRNDFRDLRSMLDHFGALCGPDDGPLPPFPPGPPGPKPECPPLPPFPDIDPCDLERRACLRELISAFQSMRNPPQTYTITSITPIDACPGDQVVIIGSNFGSAPGLVCFPFGSSTPTGTCVPATSWSDTEVRVIVPAGAGSGELQLRIVDDRVVACGKIFLITRKGEGALLFLGGRAAISSLTVNGRSTDVWVLPDTDVTVAWNASRGGAGSVVSLRITDGASVLLDRSSLAATGSLVFHTPAAAQERTLRVTAMASHRCGNDTRTLDMLITVPSELTILGMEVTQATQFSRSNLHLPAGTFQADNSVPLIENKRTLVRVYVDSGLDGFDLGRGIGVVPGITAQLHGTRGGAPLPGSPLDALNQPIEVARNALYLTVRQQWQSTLNFELPASWLTGTVTLRAVVDPAFALKRRHSGTVATQTSVSFVSARPLKLVGVMIRYTGWQIDAAANRVRVDIGAPAFATLVNAANWLRRTYPTNDIQFFTAPGNETLTFDGDLTDGSGGGCGDEWGDLMDELRDLADDYSADDDTVWIGVLPTGWGGNAWGGCGGGADGAIGVAVIFANDTGPTLAQEAGHGYGRNHAPGCGAGSPDGSYPAYGKASSASIGDFGADWPTPGSTAWQIQDPATQNDFMGYCGSDWVSPYTYMGLFNDGISSSSSLPAGDHDHGAGATVPGDLERDTLVLHGRMWRTGQVELKPAFHFRRITRAPIGSATGYRVELRDEQGRAVEDRPILVRESTRAEEQAVITFSVALPFTPKAREVVILRSEEVLLKQRISAQPPQLSALTVKPEGNKLTVQWAAQAESDKLWHKLRFSADAGRTWLGVARRLERPSCELDLGRLPGGEECIVEVYTSDGVATGRLRSAPFRVAHKLPRAVIAAPLSGESLTSGWVRLLGAGIDEGGRAITKEHLVWSSNRDGELGRGDLLDVRLSPGRHTLRLVVRDAGEREGAAEVAVKVE